MLTPTEIGRLFRLEYDRVNAALYSGKLPPFPGVKVGRGVSEYGCCEWRPEGGRPQLLGFRVTRFLSRPEDLLDTIHHEIAHAAAIVLEGHAGHGQAWKRHALACGADPRKARHERELETSARREPVAVLACRACGWRRAYLRRGAAVRAPWRFRCPECRGTLAPTEPLTR